MPCEPCTTLHRAKSATLPHPGLERLQDTQAFAGHNFAVQHYQCATCGSKLLRDMDRRDDGAIWEFER